MKQITFSSAPTQASGAALYRHALSIKQEVDTTAAEFSQQDNRGRDLCDTVGIVLDNPRADKI